jgi:hypothetical protein
MYKLGHGGVEYFVGPGGPVPLTPGYVPYVVPVRSPRDFFAFPPFSEQAMNGGASYAPSSLSGGLSIPVNPSYRSTLMERVDTPPPPAPGTEPEAAPTPPAAQPGDVPAPPVARPGY